MKLANEMLNDDSWSALKVENWFSQVSHSSRFSKIISREIAIRFWLLRLAVKSISLSFFTINRTSQPTRACLRKAEINSALMWKLNIFRDRAEFPCRLETRFRLRAPATEQDLVWMSLLASGGGDIKDTFSLIHNRCEFHLSQSFLGAVIEAHTAAERSRNLRPSKKKSKSKRNYANDFVKLKEITIITHF